MAVKRVLAVENNELVRSFIALSLGSVGYDVDTAANGREALVKIDHDTYDVIISDVRMPEVDGIELCRELKRRSATVGNRLVFLTNVDTVQEHRDFFAAAGALTLTKPVAVDDLCGAVQELIGSARD